MSNSLLDRELYDDILAARLLGIPVTTLRRWLEGSVGSRGQHYMPVLRAESTGSRNVTWGEFVEARYLREYRTALRVPLSNLRRFIGYLKDELEVQYPLATIRPWVAPGRKLVVEAQISSNLPKEFWPFVEPESGQQLILPAAQNFLDRVDFENTGNQDDSDSRIVVRMHPDSKKSPVNIDPEIRFGTPTVNGIPTESIAEQVKSGDSIESIVADFGLNLNDVIAALNFENNLLAEAA